MLNFALITGFDWDESNKIKNIDKHDVLASEAEQVFVNQPLIVSEDEAHNQQEQRWLAYGIIATGRLLFVVFTLRNDDKLIRNFSARDMTAKEKRNYERYSEKA